ncbi:glycosyltransferase family 2 protein [Parasalinivibrio latis]|uniref:glycosyltransferase family 2 protein n=1 Tax=Parasalinivibrio latis TaxID=2952610 RepID=UPI0030E3B6DA
MTIATQPSPSMSDSNDSHHSNTTSSLLSVSIVLPFYNEEDNAAAMIERINAVPTLHDYRVEIIAVNDGSDDRTLERLLEAQKASKIPLRVLELQRNFGQTAAMQAGIDAAKGGVVVTLDGDLQNDPDDIPMMVETLIRDDLDLVVGWRKARKDKLILRKIPSKIANRLIGKVTGVRLHDYGCSLKVYRASVIKQVKLYGEMHRFIPAWVACHVPKNRISEVPVKHHARTHGESKYGISRVVRVLIDLLSVVFFMRFRARPAHFFGTVGMVLGALGGGMLGWLAIQKFLFDHDIGQRPMLVVGVMLVLAAVQLMTTGVVAEILSRVYYESSSRKAYQACEYPAPGEENTKAGDA